MTQNAGQPRHAGPAFSICYVKCNQYLCIFFAILSVAVKLLIDEPAAILYGVILQYYQSTLMICVKKLGDRTSLKEFLLFLAFYWLFF